MISIKKRNNYNYVLYFVGFIFIFIFLNVLFSSISLDHSLFSHKFYTDEVLKSGLKGGVGPILLSTFLVISLAVIPSIFLSLFSGHFLFNIKNRYPLLYKMIDISLYSLIAVPSIVMGLFGNAVFVKMFGFGYSILSGSLTLMFMILPLAIKMSELSFINLSKGIVDSAKALGLSRVTMFRKVYLPCILGDIILGILISIGRGLSETAALLFTSGYATRMPENVLDSGRVLSVHIFELVMNVSGSEQMAQKSVSVLLISVILINLMAIFYAKKKRIKL